jgi:hypothetical protein
MTTSHPEDIPRNFEFLYSHNRLNVALSRARTAAIVVCSPELLKARCKTPEQMRLINALCLFAEGAQHLKVNSGGHRRVTTGKDSAHEAIGGVANQ